MPSGDRSPTDAPEDRGLTRGGDEPSAGRAQRRRRAEESRDASRTVGHCRAHARASARHPVQNLPPLDVRRDGAAARAARGSGVRKTAQNAKYDLLALRRAGVTLRGLDFDTMLASYVLDPGRRSHGLDRARARVSRPHDDVVRGSVRQGKGSGPVRRVPIELRATTRAKMRT